MEDVKSIVKNSIAELMASSSQEEITDTNLLKEDLGLSSIQLVMLMTKLSTKLGVNILEFTDQDLVLTTSVTDLVNLFNKKIETNV